MIAVASHASSIVPIIMVLLAVVLIFGSVAVTIAILWDKVPWWRTTPKPSRIVKDAKDQVKLWKVQQQYPDAFKKDSSKE